MQSNLAYDDEFEDTGPWTYDDAPDEVKKRILEKQRYREVELCGWWNCTYDDFKEQMDEKGIRVDDIFFSGFCCQGDRASFTGSIEDLDKFLASYFKPEQYPAFRNLLKMDNFYFSFKSDARDYDRCSFEYDYEDWRYLVDYDRDDLRYKMFVAINQLENADQEIQAFAKDAEEIFNREMRNIYKQLEAEHDYLTSDESVAESLDGLMFDEDGDII